MANLSVHPLSTSVVSKRPDLQRATYSLSEFAALLGIGYTQAHAAAQAGTLPVTPIRQGRKYLFPRTAVHRLLEIDSPSPHASDKAA